MPSRGCRDGETELREEVEQQTKRLRSGGSVDDPLVALEFHDARLGLRTKLSVDDQACMDGGQQIEPRMPLTDLRS